MNCISRVYHFPPNSAPSAPSLDDEQENIDSTCPICLDPLNNNKELIGHTSSEQILHITHLVCQAALGKKGSQCTLCRADLDMSSLQEPSSIEDIRELQQKSVESVHRMSESQIKKLKEPLLIQKVPLALVNQLSKSQIKHLGEEQIPALYKPALIQQVPLSKVDHISEFQVNALDAKQVRSLSKGNLIQQVIAGGTHTKHLNKEQLNLAEVGMMKHPIYGIFQFIPIWVLASLNMDSKQIRDCPPEMVPYLGGEHVLHLSLEQQIQRLTKEQLKDISEEQVPSLLEHQYKHLKKPHLVAALTQEQALRALPSQVPLLNPEFYPNLVSGKQIRRIPLEYTKTLHQDQIRHLSWKQVGRMSDAQTPFLTGWQRLLRYIFSLFDMATACFSRRNDQVSPSS